MSYVIGGLYSVKTDLGYQIAKILAEDTLGVHVTLYRNVFHDRPTIVEEESLGIGFALEEFQHNYPNFSLGMLHLPVTTETIELWDAEYIAFSGTNEREERAYYEWTEGPSNAYW